MDMKALQTLLVAGPLPDAPLAALFLKRTLPERSVTLLLTPGDPDPAGEATTPLVLQQLATTFGLAGNDIHRIARPLWSLGFRMQWGRRGRHVRAFDSPVFAVPQGLITPVGQLARKGLEHASPAAALLDAGKLFPKDSRGRIQPIENVCGLQIDPGPFSDLLLQACKAVGVAIHHGAIVGVETDENGVRRVRLDGGGELSADLYLDADGKDSPLRSALPGHAWDEASTAGLCTRAWTAVRRRGSEAVRPGVTIETIDEGWRWRIEHLDTIGFGLAYHPDFTGDDEARRLLLDKVADPLHEPRHHLWRQGHHPRPWEGNVLAVGDAAAFIEPLGSMRLPLLIQQLHSLTRILREKDAMPGEASRALYFRMTHDTWQEVRDFVLTHYRENHASDSPWWRHARETASPQSFRRFLDLYSSGGAHRLLHYALPFSPCSLGIDAWCAALIGLGVPVAQSPDLPPSDAVAWDRHLRAMQDLGRRGVAAAEVLAQVHRPMAKGPAREPIF